MTGASPDGQGRAAGARPRDRAWEYVRRAAGVLVIPVLCGAVMAACCAAAGTRLFSGTSTLRIFLRGLVYVLLLSFGVSINMHTGRFDFSTGAVMLFSGVLGALAAYENGWGPWAMLGISVAAGAASGCLTGLLYVLLRLPPMIIGLGMTLVLEGVTAIVTGGCKPVGFGTDPSYYRFSVNIPALLTIGTIALLCMVFLFRFTRFGYDYRALQTGRLIAVNTGVDEQTNAVICYAVAGALFGAAGALSLCGTNGTTPTINFSTIASMFACFLPLFFSGFIQKFVDKQVAILFGCIAYELLRIGFGQISFAVASFTADVYSVIEAVILVVFLIYLNNEGLILGTLKRLTSPQAKNQAPDAA